MDRSLARSCALLLLEAQHIDYDDMARVSIMVHDAAMRIANMDHRPWLDAAKQDPHLACRQ